ncbi:WUSCHEL-related homeobox 9 [Lactuca sativa]|uniref:Protein WUSCHEL n=1 Tax=Lactuca sativa TaxID=4236 RepID=A0A9R1XIU5_LACSA|nr:WUSCHEL-related homeobox 9 [Lactuca sativa]KAJ0211504.1 hypothetical protein LSAT_V11C400177140 [Lactuca sativa]
MTSSNRHWPSMFKSKPTYTAHQDHHGSNHVVTSAPHRSSPHTYGCDERTPEPKPRWNPKPEQIQILESIFNSGMINPPRDEIKKIRARLQEYGQVGDANVFYWFQNRKSRSKNKTRRLQKSQSRQAQPVSPTATKAATTSSSSYSDNSSSNSTEFLLHSYLGGGGGAGSHHQHHGHFFQESFFFPVQQASLSPTTASCTQDFFFPDVSTVINQEYRPRNDNGHTVLSSTSMSFTDLMMNPLYGIPNKHSKSKEDEEEDIIKTLTHSTPSPPPTASTCITAPPPPPAVPTSLVPPAPTSTIIPLTINDVEGEGGGMGKLIVFINDVPFEVAIGPFNVKEAFGSDVVLIDSSGHTVVTNDWGVTTQSLQHGAFYYLVRLHTNDHAGVRY